MPIANCFVSKKLKTSNHQRIIDELSNNLNINPNDITINFIYTDKQIGNQFELMIFLYLPSLWSKKDIEKIELSFTTVLSGILDISFENIFAITTIIESGNVVSNNRIEKW